MNKKTRSSGPAVRSSGKTTPTGVSPVFSQTARFRRETTDRLLSLFSLWGYREIILPSFEYLDAISPGLDPALLPKLYLMQDRGSGQILVLRPDATAQIARLTTQSFQDRRLPLRFCYSTSVFRDESHHTSRDRELHQTGLELLGDPSVLSDYETLELCLSGSALFPLKKPVLVLSHAGIQEGFFQSVTGDPDRLKELRMAFYSRNADHLKLLLDGSGKKDFSRLAEGVNGISGALAMIAGLSGKGSRLPAAELDSFASLLQMLQESRYAPSVLVDFALPPPGPYYTGMFFQLFAEDSPTHLASGGRYDHLGQSFGHDLPAVGFAYHINHIEEAIQKQDPFGDTSLTLAWYRAGEYQAVRQFSDSLRKRGIPVLLSPETALEGDSESLVSKNIFIDHEEIGAIVYFDREKSLWTLEKRSKVLLADASLETLAQLLFKSENR
ncbi:MAG: ATP phosphoribosyltransferase regulatory subunit [Nitrospirota bacterium]|nr:ATP phosphoribosyltransferase regulatory subunit [Nitrospirota bacterium]